MIYGSICSGIEAATVAWHPLGWRPAFFSEIEPFPRAVLAHHYPDVPLHGDFTTIQAGQYAAIDVLVGGTPCQSFSIAGLRGGLGDGRGNLALEFCRLAQRLKPRWVLWENVPGVLSLDGGRAFGSILAGLEQCGYGLAYRVLDAQFVRAHGFGRAVPQRRRRVFVVGYFGDWRRAAAVLFERESLSRNPPPRRIAGQTVAPTLSARPSGGGGLGSDFDLDGGLIPDVSKALTAARGRACANAEDQETYLPVAFGGNNTSGPIDVGTALTAHGGSGRFDFESETFVLSEAGEQVAHTLRGEGFDASEDGTGRGVPLVPVAQGVALRGRDGGATAELTGDVMTALRTGGGGGDKPHVLLPAAYAIQAGALRENASSGPDGVGVQEGHAYTLEARPEVQAVCFSAKDYGADAMVGVSPTLRAGGHAASHANAGVMPAIAYLGTIWRVRRLTPRECERLQGFPDDYTLITVRGKPAADGPRYKALGNSMAVNVMRWIGTRIEMVEDLTKEKAS